MMSIVGLYHCAKYAWKTVSYFDILRVRLRFWEQNGVKENFW